MCGQRHDAAVTHICLHPQHSPRQGKDTLPFNAGHKIRSVTHSLSFTGTDLEEKLQWGSSPAEAGVHHCDSRAGPRG